MLRRLLTSALSLVAVTATAAAGDHLYFPGHVFASPQVVYAAPQPVYAAPQVVYSAPQVVYAAPQVVYQPAYTVPTPVVSVQSYPVSTVSYSTQYYTPMVPTVTAVVARPVVASYYAPRTVIAPASYSVSSYYGHGRVIRPHYHGIRKIEFERDGDIEIKYR
jgi:hypothetical protein